MKALAVCWLLAIGAASLGAQVVLTRRDYAEHGRTFAQIWMGDVETMNFRKLTHSGRDHAEPVCSRDGKLIYFVSDPDPERSRNGYGSGGNREVWAYERRTGLERLVWRTSREYGLNLNGVTANGGLLVGVGTELRSLLRNPWVIDNVDEATVSPDGRHLGLVIAESYDKEGQSRNAKLFLADAVTGGSRIELGDYGAPAWSPDDMRIAAFFDGGVAILDPATLRETERVALPKSNAPSQDIVWSPDGKGLLVGLYGENAGSGDPQNDYFLLNLATKAWTPELTARELLWLQKTVLFLRPYETTPLGPGSPHNVWTSQLATFDLASRNEKALTSGVVLSDDVSNCSLSTR
jgi:hypothetical protein